MLPNLILAGVGKAGTTSLYWYLSQNPSICASKVKETRFFLPLSEVDPDRTGQLPPLTEYSCHFDHCTASTCVRMEATPHYFHGGASLVAGILETLPDVYIVLILRDPVDRLWSIFRFAKSMLLIPNDQSLESFVSVAVGIDEKAAAQTRRNRPYWTSVRGSMYSEFLPSWIETIPSGRLKILFFEDLRERPECLTGSICTWLNLGFDADDYSFSVENQSFDYRSRTLQRIALFANSERLLRNRRVLKQSLRPLYRRINQARQPEKMPVEVRKYLDEVFLQSNEAVYRQLAESGESDFPPWLARFAG